MSPEKTERLYKRFPHLYQLGIEQKDCMKWGISTDDGWFDLIYRLSLEITEECTRLGLIPGEPGYPVATQVKEKFGTLRFYLHATKPERPEFTAEEIQHIRDGAGAGNDKFQRMEAEEEKVAIPGAVYAQVNEATKLSASTCERCGAPGKLRVGSWVHVTCDRCESDHKKGGWL